jgi:hypothetical protein
LSDAIYQRLVKKNGDLAQRAEALVLVLGRSLAGYLRVTGRLSRTQAVGRGFEPQSDLELFTAKIIINFLAIKN